MIKQILVFSFLVICIKIFPEEKMAYLNYDEIIEIMPEYIQMQDSIQKFQTSIQSRINFLEKECKKKYELLINEDEKLAESVKNIRIQEIKNIEEKINLFYEQSQKEFQKTYEQLLYPIQIKIQNAIKDVGNEHNFSYILKNNNLLYISSDAPNATTFVKNKLGFK